MSVISYAQKFIAQPGTMFLTGNVNNNLSMGMATLRNITTGVQNVALGRTSTLNGLTSGSYNIGLGFSSGLVLTTGDGNTFIGGNVDVQLSGSSSGNTFIGFRSGNTGTSCSYTTLIGNGTRHGDFSNSTAIGTGTVCTANHQIIFTGGILGFAILPGTTSNGSANFSGYININKTPTTVNGSTSGSVNFNMIQNGITHKEVIIYLNALNGTASYTFPTAFQFTPAVIINSNIGGLTASVVTSLSTTSITITGTTQTGFIYLEGY